MVLGRSKKPHHPAVKNGAVPLPDKRGGTNKKGTARRRAATEMWWWGFLCAPDAKLQLKSLWLWLMAVADEAAIIVAFAVA